jgi:hypothetical protein
MEAGNRGIKKVRERYNAVRGHAVKGKSQEIIRGLLCGTDPNRLDRAVVKSKQVFEQTVQLGEVVAKDQLIILKIL